MSSTVVAVASLPAVFSCKTVQRPTFVNAETIASSDVVLRGSRFDRRVAENRKGSWVRQTTRSRRTEPSTVTKSTSSSEMLPPTTSIMRIMARIVELFPLPVRPTKPTFSPASTEKLMFLTTGFESSPYVAKTSLNSMAPRLGQLASGLPSSPSFFSTGVSSANCLMRRILSIPPCN